MLLYFIAAHLDYLYRTILKRKCTKSQLKGNVVKLSTNKQIDKTSIKTVPIGLPARAIGLYLCIELGMVSDQNQIFLEHFQTIP